MTKQNLCYVRKIISGVRSFIVGLFQGLFFVLFNLVLLFITPFLLLFIAISTRKGISKGEQK